VKDGDWSAGGEGGRRRNKEGGGKGEEDEGVGGIGYVDGKINRGEGKWQERSSGRDGNWGKRSGRADSKRIVCPTLNCTVLSGKKSST